MMACDGLEGWGGVGWGGAGRETQEGGAICIHMADSFLCTAATNTICQAAIPNFEKFFSQDSYFHPGVFESIQGCGL